MSLTVIEAAERLDVSHQRIYALMARDVLVPVPGTANPVHVTTSSVESFAADRDGPPEGWVTIADAADHAGCDVSTIRNWISTGRLTASVRRTGMVVLLSKLDALEPLRRGRPPGVSK